MTASANESGTTVTRRRDGVPRLDLDRGTCSDYPVSSGREWLVTNGTGSYAAGTVSGAATRRYHGLLVAALQPPARRTVLVAGLDAFVEYQGRPHPLWAHEYSGASATPDGCRHVEAFTLNGGMPVWSFAIGDARLTQLIWMGRGVDTTYIRFRLESASGPVRLRLSPLCTFRDFHAESRGERDMVTTAVPDGMQVAPAAGSRAYRLLCAEGRCEPRGDWYWNFHHRLEAERGLDCEEDLFRPCEFLVDLEIGQVATLICTAEPAGKAPDPPAAALDADRHRRARLLLPVVREPGWVRQLVLATDQFIVRRDPVPGEQGGQGGQGSQDGHAGSTVIAGYPWFGDWGRDTMISLPGLTLHTGRSAVAAEVLRTFAGYVSQGMLPNRFPDDASPPEYNTADASLWYFDAIAACHAAAGDAALVRDLWPKLVDMIDWHQRGTRHGIGMDPADGLLRAGEPGVQLTWMDAKTNGEVVTPRIGKPVEINALWHRALRVMAELAAIEDEPALARHYQGLADRVRDSFRQRFWFAGGGYLHDVVDGPGGNDVALRPNQILAVSLDQDLLEPAMAAQVVATCQRELLTPMGLRTLDRGNSRYRGRYGGGPRERDGAYHQGTVWPWLLGPFALAHFRVHRDRAAAQALLAGIGTHLAEACVGSISEIFDGDAPHWPRGCFAQAWSVAAILHAWFRLKDAG